MANTYTQLYVHVVFVVRGRANVISARWKEELYKYITGIVTKKGQKLIAINGMPDHVHMLVGMKPDLDLSDLMMAVKANSSRFINEKRFVAGKFEWQKGFAGFSLGYSQLNMVGNYIQRQEEHHRMKTFREEYLELLKENDISFKNEYLFEEV